MTLPSKTLLALLPVALALYPRAGDAAAYDREYVHSGASFCTVMNPDLDGSVRRLSTGLANVSASPVAVTCAVATDTAAGSLPIHTDVRMRNDGAGTGTGSCTILAGSHYDAQVSVKRSKKLNAGTAGVITFDADQYGAFKQFAFSCTLPVGWTIEELIVYSVEEVGQ